MKRILLSVALVLLITAVQAQTKSKKPQAKSTKTTTAKTTTTKTASTGGASLSSPALYQKWIHSFEDEKGDGIEVYRPEGYSFPPARGRKAVKFQKDGSLVRFDIGPADGTKFLMGKWERTKFGNTMKVIIDGGESSVYFWEVVSVSKDMLKVRRKSEI